MVADALRNVVTTALGDLDPTVALESFDGDDGSDDVISRITDALQTPAFLVPRRVVVVRGAHQLGAGDIEILLGWMASPTPDVTLVLSVVGAKSAKLAKAASQLVETSAGQAKENPAYVAAKFAEYGVKVTATTAQQICDVLGDEMERVDQLARTVQGVVGETSASMADIEPYLGDMGDVPPWILTGAIEKGDTVLAITTVRRMLDSRGKAAMQVLFSLRRYFLDLASILGSNVNDPDDAVAIIGGKPGPMSYRLQFARRLGEARLRECVRLIAEADLALKGGMSFGGKDLELDQDVTELTVLEILVARLARHGAAATRR
jgi:DNA polymerase III delta subunit